MADRLDQLARLAEERLETRAELERLEARVAELERLEARVAELERLSGATPMTGPSQFGVEKAGTTRCRGCHRFLDGCCVDFDRDNKMSTNRYCTRACARLYWEDDYALDNGEPPAAEYRLQVNARLDPAR